MKYATLAESFPYDTAVVVSPHPDDSCIAAGGLLRRLSREAPACRTHVLVMTSGYRGVTDQYLAHALTDREMLPCTVQPDEARHCLALLKDRRTDESAWHAIRHAKAAIRRAEVLQEAQLLGFKPHFLQLGLYEEHCTTDRHRSTLQATLETICPDNGRSVIVYPGAFDLHGTHRLCSQLVNTTLCTGFLDQIDRWTYESPWTQTRTRPDIIVPLSAKDMSAKARATAAHRSQTDRTPYTQLMEGTAISNAAMVSEMYSYFSADSPQNAGTYAEVFSREFEQTMFTMPRERAARNPGRQRATAAPQVLTAAH